MQTGNLQRQKNNASTFHLLPRKRYKTTDDGMLSAGSAFGPPSLVPVRNKYMNLFVVACMWIIMLVYTLVVLFGDTLLLPKDEMNWCRAAQQGYPVVKQYPNPDTNNNPCYRERTLFLLGLSPFEVDFSRRMITAVVLGSAIGWERKAADRPAGIRTMSLVCLGACFFTLCSQHAFQASTQSWDAARVSAAIPSGVSFLCSALVWKHTFGEKGSERHEVHGLTTAASVWLSASVGIGAGGHLYVVSIYAVILVIFVLRLGPRMMLTDDASSMNNETEESEWEEEDEQPMTRQEQRELLNAQTAAQMESPTRKIRRRPSRLTFHN